VHPQSDQMDENQLEEERFDGYDIPGGAQGGNTGGAGGGQPPRGGTVAGGDDPGDSSSSFSDSDGFDASPPDPRDFLGCHSHRNRALMEWSQFYMKDGKVDRFIDELMRLVVVLGYSGEFVKDRARMGMTDILNAAWSMKTPHPVAYMDYLDLLRQTRHQPEDASNFRTQVQKEPHSLRGAKRDDRHTSERKGQRKEKKATRPRQQKPRNRAQGFTKPAETDHTKIHRNVPQTQIDKCKRLNQCSRCGQDGHYWAKCPSTNPVVASSHLRRKGGAGEAGHEATQVPKSRRIEAAPKTAVKEVVPELRGSTLPDLEILEVDTDMDD